MVAHDAFPADVLEGESFTADSALVVDGEKWDLVGAGVENVVLTLKSRRDPSLEAGDGGAVAWQLHILSDLVLMAPLEDDLEIAGDIAATAAPDMAAGGVDVFPADLDASLEAASMDLSAPVRLRV